MRMSTLFAPTERDDPADAEVASHKFLIRAGFIRMVSRGIYSYLPLGWRTLRKIETIVREEMDRAGAQEILMPGVQPRELWEESGRWEQYGKELLRFTDRKGAGFALGPTHEEVVTDIARRGLKSHKQLPVNLYQIQTKFRDEPRPRFGLMRGREFIMKDAYSFDIDAEGAKRSYENMKAAYDRIFERMGFEFSAVEADTGNIGGSLSHEFQVIADTGEDLIVTTPSGYAANVEKAAIQLDMDALARAEDAELGELTLVDTPKKKTIEEVAEFLSVAAEKVIKTLILEVNGEHLAVLLRGDHELNDIKLKALLNAQEDREAPVVDIEFASDEAVGKLTKAPVGFAGPIGLEGVRVYADWAVRPMVDAVVGGMAKDKHYTGANWGRDYAEPEWADLRMAREGDVSAKTGEVFTERRGIEVGHIFYLGTKYSEAMKAQLQSDTGELCKLEMGCYGIGITRIMAASVEQNHDDHGIIWPMPIAPYHVTVLALTKKSDEIYAEAQKIYEDLRQSGVEVVFDDRAASPGVKFKDAELIGFPLIISVGKRGVQNGVAEFKLRSVGEKEEIALAEVSEHIRGILGDEGVWS